MSRATIAPLTDACARSRSTRYALAHAQRPEHRRDADEAREHEHHQARAVDAEVVLDADRRQPVELLLVLHRREEVLELVVGNEQDEHQAEVREESDLLHQRVVATARVGHGRDCRRREDRDPDQEAEQDRRREDAGPCRTSR
jgi:hypothetical protein